MARFCSLFSSSSGNCTYIGTADNGILIDAGVSAKRIVTALSERNIDPSNIDAIFVTHEHSDHISGIKVLASKYGIKVYSTEGTLQGMEAAGILNGKFDTDVVPYCGTEVGNIFVKPFKTPHDTRESCAYTVMLPGETKISVVTDIGHMSEEMLKEIYHSDAILIESNHDVGMLKNGEYPYILKKRILSETGHLCNEDCAKAVVDLFEHGTNRFYLGHLSEKNNLPLLALHTTLNELQAKGAVRDKDFKLDVCSKADTKGVEII